MQRVQRAEASEASLSPSLSLSLSLYRKYKGELDEMMQRVQRSEASEADSKSELSELLSAHDKLQDKWREASRTMAAQSQRHITDLREQVGRLDVYLCM